MRKILLQIFFVLIVVSARKNLKQVQKKKAQEHRTVVESNHFYSNYELFTHYDINGVEKNKSLIFTLKPQDNEDNNKLQDNPITITLTSGKIVEKCIFKSFSNLCTIPKIEDNQMGMRLQCKKLPCELSWVILQPALIEQDGKHDIDKLIEVNEDNKHATIVVSCNNPNIKTFADDIRLYTNSQFKQIKKNQVVYYLFNNEKGGHFFLTAINNAAKSCARVNVKHAPSQIDFNLKDNILKDFLNPNEVNVYQFKKIPETDFRIDCSAHDLSENVIPVGAGLNVSLFGADSTGIKKIIRQLRISIDQTDQRAKKFIDFSLIFKKPSGNWENLEFRFTGLTTLLIVNIDFVAAQRQQVNFGQESFFELEKGQSIKLKLLGEEQESDESKKAHIFLSDDKMFKLSQSECSVNRGCEFSLQALESGKGMLYFGESAAENKNQFVTIDFEHTVSKKIRQGQQVQLKRVIKSKKTIQVVVNTPMVIVHVARKDKCPVVSKNCYQKVLNSHNPIIYEPESDGELIFRVLALQNCKFTLTVIDQNSQFIQLRDTIPFSYLFDDQESSLIFHFKLAKKGAVNFNLIGPLNELSLLVVNADNIEEDDNAGAVSADGFVSFPEEEISSLNFFIKVEKREEFRLNYAHFTIVVSTKENNMRLQSGGAHYETIGSKDWRDYVFEFQPKKEMLLNFYTQNLDSGIDLQLLVSNADEFDKEDQTLEFTIDQSSDVLELKDVSQSLCEEMEGENCELFIRITNRMNVEVDLAITLLISDAVIELKEGIWQNYHINAIASTAHFYYLPKHQNKSITMLYRSSYIDLKIIYSLWKTDDKSIDPTEWPFPLQFKQDPKKQSVLNFRPTQYIHIDSSSLKGCWPNCVVLLSVAPDKQSLVGMYKSFRESEQFKIMATSTFIQVPQKTKIDVVLKREEERHLLVDLKYAIQKDALTFFTYFTIGSVQLSANVYQETNPRCPTIDESADFRFGNLETQLSIQSIKEKMAENELDLNKNTYICIMAHAYLDSKFSIQFTSENQVIKQILLDTFQIQKSVSKQSVLLQVDANQEFYLKITRNEGFPCITSKLCKEDDDFEDCLETFKDQAGNQNQMVDKMITISEQPCSKCILFVKVYSDEPSEVNLHCQSKYTQIELIQNQIQTDSLGKNEQNRYLLTSLRNELLIINIQTIHGSVKATVDDFQDVHIQKKSQGGNNIHFGIPAKDLSNKNSLFGQSFLGMFGLSTFTNYHLIIESLDQKVPAMYTVTYSSGQEQTYLQDGLIMDYHLSSKTPTKFLYKNPALTPIYLLISTQDAKEINQLKLKIFAVSDMSDEDSGIQITPETVNFKRKTPNPTTMIKLPANRFYEIEVNNPSDKYLMFTIGVNNREIIMLPFDRQFPLQLGIGEHIYLVLNIPYGGNVQVTFSKCDESKPTVGYTSDYNEFINEQFSFQEELSDDLISDLYIKIKKNGNLYVKVKSSEDDKSLMTVKAKFNYVKTKEQRAKPGDKGVITYKLMDSTRATVTFSALVCPPKSKSCSSKDFTYSSITSDKIENVYSQLACPSMAFDLQDIHILHSAETTPLNSPATSGNKITYTQAIKGEVEYVGVKAIDKSGQVVYYKPVEILTFWGQIQKRSKSRNLFIIFGFGLLLCCGLVIYRRFKKRNQYSQLEGDD